MTYEEAHDFLEDIQREMTLHRNAYSDRLIEANGIAILAIGKQIEMRNTRFTHLCKSDRDLYPTEFTIFAMAQYNLDGTVTVDRFQKFGALHVGKITIPKEAFEKYYKECEQA